MTKPLPCTKAMLRRAADVARERGVRVTVKPDGSIVVDPTPDDTTSPSDARWSDVQP
jgi:hypothetical protein